ncbi:MAG: hypothetical protein M1829_005292 [Trizodia sp. TS-e1964]|nr:MAG: hypothetical protein M1829_005292 [Trizodia sp. TS-e1964]
MVDHPFASAVSRLLGWTYFLCWSFSFYPQVLLNIKRRSTLGLAIDFPTINVLGFVCYAVSTAAFLYSPTIRSQYAFRNHNAPTVRANDLAFALHAVVLSSIAYSQFFLWGFARGAGQRASRPILGIAAGALASIVVVALIVRVKGTGNPAGWAEIDIVYTIGYVKLLVTTVKYIPQAWANYTRQSTDGWSIHQILLDVAGGVLSLSQLVLDSSFQDDWSGLTGNPVKLGLSNVSIFFDVIFIVQHYWLYRGARRGAGAKALDDGAPLLHAEGRHAEAA